MSAFPIGVAAGAFEGGGQQLLALLGGTLILIGIVGFLIWRLR